MNKFILILGFIAIFASVLAVHCPPEDENSQATYYPHETQCGMFYECDHGSAKLMACPNGLYWDSRLNVCNRNVDCGNLSTSTATPTATPTVAPTEAPTEPPTEAPAPSEAPEN